MTDAQLIHALEMYWQTRGTPAAVGWWKAISAEIRRRKRRQAEQVRKAA